MTPAVSSTQPPLARLEAVGRSYDAGAVISLREIDLAIAEHDCLAILGPSGSGKSSIINMLSGIDCPTSGRVLWGEQPVTSRAQWSELRRTRIGIVFQEFHLLPTLTAVENVELALFGSARSARARRQAAQAALNRVGLAARAGHQPHALSGGERQRVAIARSIVNAPAVILADEPTGNLDSANAAMVMDLLLDLHRQNDTALVLVTHDEALAGRCSRSVRIKDGRIVGESVGELASDLSLTGVAP